MLTICCWKYIFLHQRNHYNFSRRIVVQSGIRSYILSFGKDCYNFSRRIVVQSVLWSYFLSFGKDSCGYQTRFLSRNLSWKSSFGSRRVGLQNCAITAMKPSIWLLLPWQIFFLLVHREVEWLLVWSASTTVYIVESWVR